MKSNNRKSERAWVVEWRTPIGTMSSRVEETGWTDLNFPDAELQSFPERIETDPIGIVAIKAQGAGTPQAPPDRLMESMAGFLGAYFQRRPSEGPQLAPREGTSFSDRVREQLRRVPFGKHLTYGGLAEAAGSPKGARAAGQAMARNRLVLAVPCHRVLGAGPTGSILGGFTGGLAMKRWLLRHEGIHCPPGPGH